jgi:hypothetical protein
MVTGGVVGLTDGEELDTPGFGDTISGRGGRAGVDRGLCVDVRYIDAEQ